MKFITYLVLLTLLISSPAYATDQDDIAHVQEYLNTLRTAQAEFTQIDPNGNESHGTFYLNRPGKLRFEYDAPINDFVVADGTFIYFYDSELKEQSNAPIGQTLADFILRDKLELGSDISVNEIKRGAGLLQINMLQTSDPEAGAILLGFTEEPLQLKKWRVTDAQGSITEITLDNLKTGINLSNNLFYYRDPARDVIKYNQ